jgi:hypothetical protein
LEKALVSNTRNERRQKRISSFDRMADGGISKRILQYRTKGCRYSGKDEMICDAVRDFIDYTTKRRRIS